MRHNTVISLGAHCDVAFAIRWFFGTKTVSPFDWLVTPCEAMAAILREEGDGLGREFEVVQAGQTVQCRRYGVLYHHEFPRDPATANLQFSVDAIESCRSKLAHKMVRMRTLARASRPLFIRYGVGGGGGKHNYAPVETPDLIELDEALRAFCGHDDFRLTIVQQHGDRANLGGIADPSALPSRFSIRHEGYKNGFDATHHEDWGAFFRDHGFGREDDITLSGRREESDAWVVDVMDLEAANRAVQF